MRYDSDLDAEDREILESYENEEWQSVPDLESEIDRLREVARATIKKDRRVNIRLSSRDLDLLKVRALEEGLPYQTLISSLLHKFVNDRLVERRQALRRPTVRWDEVAEKAD